MDPLNLILLIIVALIGWRLRSVLGTRNDDEKPGSRADAYRLNRDAFANRPEELEKPEEAPQTESAPQTEDVPQTKAPAADETGARDDAPEAGDAGEAAEAVARETETPQGDAPMPQMGRGLAFLREVEPQFDEAGFLDGAASAYEMILTAFANGDLSPVEGFLGPEVTDGFAAAIVARRDNDQQLVTQILRMDRPLLEDATISETHIQLDVRFRAEIISAVFPAAQEVGDDELPAPTSSLDVWRFEGQRGSAPNWTLIATQAE